jgi:NTE family protein
MRQTLVFIFLLNFSVILNAQKVGVVLSGGGATALAHIGVLKALEENEIPIDYIAGTSAGALIGAMYAVGFSPNEIEAYVLSPEYLKMANGEFLPEQRFMLKKELPDASLLNIPFSRDSIFLKSLPTNFITPALMDFEMFKYLGITSIQKKNDFNNLFVPFLCVAADIVNKESVVFRKGHLNAAVRASMTFPFYINPIRINDKLLFDGGLYDNFPAQELYNAFNVDYLIGSNVSFNAAPPTEDDLISQITNMLVFPTDFELPCENGVLIQPQNNVGTFEFNRAKEAIDIGYQTALLYVDSIKLAIGRSVSNEELSIRRAVFKEGNVPVNFTSVVAKNKNNENIKFVEQTFIQDSVAGDIDFEQFTKIFFRLYASPQIKYIFPTVNKKDKSEYELVLDVTKQQPFNLKVGGHFSSRPVNTGFVGLGYKGLSESGFSIDLGSYFGKFYSAAFARSYFDIPTKIPFRISPYFIQNRWDYFLSFNNFFQESTPSFLVQNERYFGTRFILPLGNKYRLSADFRGFYLRDEYYQSENFTGADTADLTNFEGQSAILKLEHNTLNRKQWATKGSALTFSFRYIQGREQSISGSTSPIDYDVRKFHRWINLTLEGEKYIEVNDFFTIGYNGKGVLNSQSLFANYTASILAMTEFSPLPDAQTFFFEEYRAPQYLAGGGNLIFHITSFLDLRIDAHFFQPFRQIVRTSGGGVGYSNLLQQGTPMVGGTVVFHSPIGPLRFSTNYFPSQSQPFTAQLSYGYVLFENRAIR